ncbi:MAG: sortase [Propionibacteriaceae bacterium]|nr:sortase [Propionibacteriaceae bacterium]
MSTGSRTWRAEPADDDDAYPMFSARGREAAPVAAPTRGRQENGDPETGLGETPGARRAGPPRQTAPIPGHAVWPEGWTTTAPPTRPPAEPSAPRPAAAPTPAARAAVATPSAPSKRSAPTAVAPATPTPTQVHETHPAQSGPPQPPHRRGPSRAVDPEDPPSRRKDTKTKAKKSKAATVFLVFGVAWLAAGLGMLGWVAWELWGTNIGVRSEYDDKISELESLWDTPASATPSVEPTDEPPVDDEGVEPTPEPTGYIAYDLGQGFAILDIPKLGLRVPILAGTTEASLSHGVGWENTTALPGQYGNFVVAGHHSSRGHPFDKLQDLVAGDRFTVETQDYIYTYEMLNSPADLTVTFTETWVELPDPIEQTMDTNHKYATLLTCKEFFATPDRSIGFAELVSEVKK